MQTSVFSSKDISNTLELHVLCFGVRSLTSPGLIDGRSSLACTRTLSYSGLLWNNLPEELHTANSLGLFKRKIHRL